MDLRDIDKIEDPEVRAQFQALVDSIRKARAHYHLPPEPLEHPTLEEMKEGDRENVTRLIRETLDKHQGKNDMDDWVPLWYRSHIHDRELPNFIRFTVLGECWTKEGEQDLVHNGWTKVEWPGQWGNQWWRDLFERTDFWCNHDDRYDEPCSIHPDPEVAIDVTAWRGSFASDRRGLSWTLDRDRALWFVKRGDMAHRGRTMRLWRCDIPADRQYLHAHNRSEDEIVADVRRLPIIREEP